MLSPFRVGDRLVQPERNHISNNEGELRVEPRAMQVLIYLAERGGEVVSREELLEKVWEGTFVTDEVLTSAIKKLRKALGDDAKDPRFIQTVPGRGYRLNASVVSDIPKKSETRGRYVGIAVFLTLVGVGIAAWFILSSSKPPIVPARLTRVTAAPGVELHPSLSPDGQTIVYSARPSGSWDIYRKRVDGERAFNLTEDFDGDDFMPVFSPDGRRIAFRSERNGGGIYIMGATGESPRRVTDFGYNPSFSPDGGELVIATAPAMHGTRRNAVVRSELHIVNLETGTTRLLTEGDAVQPSWSPHGYCIAYWSMFEEPSLKIGIRTIEIKGGEPSRVLADEHENYNPVWAPSGDVLYFTSNRSGGHNLWMLPIDETTGRARGDPVEVTLGGTLRHGQMSLSRDGQRLAYAESGVRDTIYKLDFDPLSNSADGEPVLVKSSSKSLSWPTPSPEGQRLAFTEESTLSILNLERPEIPSRRIAVPTDCYDPRWSPDGRHIAFTEPSSSSLWIIRPDGSGLRRFASGGHTVWSPKGELIATMRNHRSCLIDPFELLEERPPEVLTPMPDGEHFEVFSWSPDGHWLAGNAFVLDEKGAFDKECVAIFNFETGAYTKLTGPGVWVESDSGDDASFGHWPRWLNDSRKLLFRTLTALYLADRVTKKIQSLYSAAPNVIGRVGLSRDDRSIFFSQRKAETDIWVLDLK